MNNDYIKKSKKFKGYHYSELSSVMLEYLHNKVLEMLKTIIPIFDKHDIRYFLCGGTLLGAVTTGKILPWDVDIDVCVLEDDYEKMINVLTEELPDSMIVQSPRTEEKYYHGWVKVVDKNSHVYPDIASYTYNGIWIDIYRLTLSKKSEVPFHITKEHYDYLIRRYNVGEISESEKDKRIRENNLIERMEKEKNDAIQSSDESKSYIVWSVPTIPIDEEMCFPRKKYKFEGMELYSFNDADAYLKGHYGENYMEMPPIEQRLIGINKIELITETDNK